ncbi:MAG: hypothetical protein CL802_13475 [Citromicrobium sp.]|nr:hypothetical protein [Citromicrobium sp.]|tara:strand:- start:18757 stop:19359 length:603 start_codon:yes stop_codon:yes gene_type:complete
MSAGAAATGIQIAGVLLGGFEANGAARRDARVLDENARLTQLAGEEDIADVMREERQVSGMAIAAMATSATTVGTGTAADIIMQNAVEREVEIGNLRAKADGEARNFRQAAQDRRAEGRSAIFNSAFQAAGIGLETKAAADARKVKAEADAADHASRMPRPALRRGTVSVTGTRGAYDAVSPRDPLMRRRFGVIGLPGGY